MILKKTIKEYRELVAIKKTILKDKELSIIWNNQELNKDIAKVAESIYNLDFDSIKETTLSYKVMRIKDKKDETLDLPNLMKIELYVRNYYLPIKNSFKFLELQEKAKSDFIFSQVKTFYLALKMQGFTQNEIFEKMVDWFMTNTTLKDRSKSEILVSFFIQNCEVLS